MSIKISNCRICGSSNFEELFNLGEQPLANALRYDISPDQPNIPEEKYPLVLVRCGACSHVQLKHTVTPDEMFVEYHFHTASSPRMVKHYSDAILNNIWLEERNLIVEIGSNDGAVLESVSRRYDQGLPIRLLGVDPSKNLCEEASSRGVGNWCAFFGEQTARDIVGLYGQARLIFCANVLGHVPDLNDFCAGLKTLVAKDGQIIIEVPHVLELYNRLAFDTVYHEHVSYFSIKCLVDLMNRNGLYVQCIEKQEVHGGTLRFYIKSHGGNHKSIQLDIWNENIEELDWSVFKDKVDKLKNKLLHHLWNLGELAGESVVGYGAAAKAAVLLNYCEISKELLGLVVDCTPDKQGKLMPGTHQKIISPEKLYEISQQQPGPDNILILAWNHAQEIVNNEQPRFPKTRFLTPDLKIVQVLAQG